MAAKSGAGAAVSSGASYQARVGAYAIASSLCGVDSLIADSGSIERISFETTEKVDDINIVLMAGDVVYIQAKATIGYSVGSGGELHSVLSQFEAQATSGADKLALVTSSRASKKVIYDLRAALDAFRSSPEQEFFRDQPRALTGIISQLRSVLSGLRKGVGRPESAEAIDEVLRKMWVFVLDVENGDPLEHAITILLESKSFLAAPAVWGKLVSDCVSFGRRRHTVSLLEIEKQYERFRISDDDGNLEEVSDEILKVEISEAEFSAGRDLSLCVIPEGVTNFQPGYAVVETYRFDEHCAERLEFREHSVVFAGSVEIPLLRRAATYEGMTRILENDPSLVEDNEVTLYPINSDENFEDSACATTHRERLQRALESNTTLLNCVHCSKAVFSVSASVVELQPLEKPIVGLAHEECLQPADRVIGSIQSDFVREHPELVNFDVNAWYRAIHGGQSVFASAQHLAGGQKVRIAWGGLEPRGPDGAFVVEISLRGGGREIVTRRNGVQRFSKSDAEEFAANLNKQFEIAREKGDPLCYSDESKTFGPRSEVLKLIGAREKIIPIEHARTRKYDVKFAIRYTLPGHWYAPLLYLRERETGEPVIQDHAILMITDPLKLSLFLENWKSIEVDVEGYELAIILNDGEFDEFMRWGEGKGYSAIVDPIFDPASSLLISGYPIRSTESMLAERQS